MRFLHGAGILAGMLSRPLIILALTLVLAACVAAPAADGAPAPAPFPSITPGRLVVGLLPTVEPVSADQLFNPATAVALARRPTPTPDYAACPPPANPSLGNPPTSSRQAANAAAAFLSAGGAPQVLVALMQTEWGLLSEAVTVRTDTDLTGEGIPDVLVVIRLAGSGAALLALACANGRYAALHEVFADSPIQLLHAGDINLDARPDLLYAVEQCQPAGRACTYRLQLLSWERDTGSFVALMAAPINSPTLPVLADVDSDGILEVAIRLTDSGNAETGPLRTGLMVYDWDGVGYALSITQLDPPRFRVQVIHEADRSLLRQDIARAAEQYALALNDAGLRNWHSDDQVVLTAYALYRLLTAYAYTEDRRLLATYQELARLYPDPAAAPVYALLGEAFWRAFQTSNNLRSACAAVQDIIAQRPEALSLINRYGSRSPTYTATDLCPF